ncbi:ankyrin repeat-containing domain protein [Baffinella frigidus]|nr:ankyrin repeat-containing domain protein [Cryptophyta sp. CCMP2293]
MAAVTTVPDPALWTASKTGRAEEVRRLLVDGPDVEERRGVPKTTPLVAAAFRGHTPVVNLLLEHGADCLAKDTYGYTPLHRSALMGHKAVVLVLLEKGPNVSATDCYGMTALR